MQTQKHDVVPAQKVIFYKRLTEQLLADGFRDEAESLAKKMSIAKDDYDDSHMEADATGDDASRFSNPWRVKNKSHGSSLFQIYMNSNKYSKGEHSSIESKITPWKPVICRPIPPLSTVEPHLDLTIPLSKYQPGVTEDGAPELEGDETMIDDNEEDFIDRLGTRNKIPVPRLKLRFTAQHKKECSSIAFSNDGLLCASGSVDTSIKIMETSRLKMHSSATDNASSRSTDDSLKPVVRTFYDHVGPVTTLAFHPRYPSFFSGSLDKTIKIYDLTKANQNKRAVQTLTDSHPINTIACHPSGDFLYAGTSHRIIRLYDLTTLQCYCVSTGRDESSDSHNGVITSLTPSADGRYFVSTSTDGDILVSSGLTNKLVNRFSNSVQIEGSPETQLPHNGYAVFTSRWSRNQRYILTSGGDNRARLWDTRMGKLLLSYGTGLATECPAMAAVLACDEKYVVTTSTRAETDIQIHCAKSGTTLLDMLPEDTRHPQAVRCLAEQPSDRSIATGCNDHKFRYFEIDVGGL